MVLCSLLGWLTLMAMMMVSLAVFANPLLSVLARFGERLCRFVCRIAIILALLGGIVLGIWLAMCGPRLWRVLVESHACVPWIVLSLLLLIVALVLLLLAIAACRSSGRGWTTIVLVVLFVLLWLMLYKIRKCCHLNLSMILYGDTCAWLLALAVTLFFLGLLLYMLYLRACRPPNERACSRIRLYVLVALVLGIVALVLIFVCCKYLGEKDFDLAMLGIWWDGQYQGEAGAHLRWAFRYGLPFPPGGFDLYRRPSSGGAWAKLNGAPIRPADVFQDAAPAPGPMWEHRAVDRLHPSRWAHFQGASFDALRDMVQRPPYSLLYFVQEPDDPVLPVPASPYDSEAALTAYLDAYRAAGTAANPATPLAQWRLEPMQAMMIAGLHPDIARLLGLLYIDKTAAPDTEYDYRVIGHWADGDRSYTVKEISRPLTAPLAPPQLQLAQTPVAYPAPGGLPTSEDKGVALRWEPPTASPEFGLTATDGIRPVRYLPRVQLLGARPCPAPPAPGPAFLPARRKVPNGEEDIAPLAVTPEESGGTLVWPAFFYVDRNVDYHCYGYTLEGIDIFGRVSPLSNVLVADVQDHTGPPPPVNVEARVFQRADTSVLDALPAAERDALFPPATTHAAALRVSWVWPNAFLTTVPDFKEFRVYHRINGYTAFSQPANQPQWPNAANWTDAGLVVPLAAGQPIPARLAATGVPAAGAYFEAILFEPPMNPDDEVPVVYGFAGVGGIDHDPFNNRGPVSPPTVIFARDFIPPLPPPIPAVDRGPDPTDKGSNALLGLSWDADARYLYQLVRVPGKRIAALPAPAGPVPPCLAAAEPTCAGLDPECVEQKRQFAVRLKANAHPNLFGTASLSPEAPQPAASGHRFAATDKVDATLGDDYAYAGRAIDRAGNVGPIGCPQLAVVRDFMPPRAPTVTEIVGVEGAVRLQWAVNPEGDLARYRIHRTADPSLDGSLARMPVIFEASSDGSALAPAGAPAAALSGTGTAYPKLTWEDAGARPLRDAFYRLVAIDNSGNISELSASARGRPVDTTPPVAPAWSASPARGTDATGAFIDVHFTPPPGDGDARFRVQRQDAGAIFWRPVSGWLAPGSTTHRDRTAPATATTYRVQAMDVAGNVGPFTVPQAVP